MSAQTPEPTTGDVNHLRLAAETLRGRAAVATPGPWQVSRSGSFVCADHPQVARSARVVAKADDEWIDHRSNATFIATMSPPVALALADLLDEWISDCALERGHIGYTERALIAAILGDGV